MINKIINSIIKLRNNISDCGLKLVHFVSKIFSLIYRNIKKSSPEFFTYLEEQIKIGRKLQKHMRPNRFNRYGRKFRFELNKTRFETHFHDKVSRINHFFMRLIRDLIVRLKYMDKERANILWIGIIAFTLDRLVTLFCWIGLYKLFKARKSIWNRIKFIFKYIKIDIQSIIKFLKSFYGKKK